MSLGSALARLGTWKEAADAFEAASHLKPDHPDPLVELGGAALHVGDPGRAKRCSPPASPFVPITRRRRSSWAMRASPSATRWAASRRTARRWSSIRTSPRCGIPRAKMLVGLKREAEAAEAFLHALATLEEAARATPERADVHADLGLAYVALGRYADGVDELEHARGIEPHNTAVIAPLATAYEKLERYVEAVVSSRGRSSGTRKTTAPPSASLRSSRSSARARTPSARCARRRQQPRATATCASSSRSC